MTEEVTYADLKFVTLEKLQTKDIQTARAKGSVDVGWGQLSTGQTFTLDNILMWHSEEIVTYVFPKGDLWTQIFKEIGGTEKWQDVKKNVSLEKGKKVLRFERQLELWDAVRGKKKKKSMFRLDIKCQVLEVSEVI